MKNKFIPKLLYILFFLFSLSISGCVVFESDLERKVSISHNLLSSIKKRDYYTIKKQIFSQFYHKTNESFVYDVDLASHILNLYGIPDKKNSIVHNEDLGGGIILTEIEFTVHNSSSESDSISLANIDFDFMNAGPKDKICGLKVKFIKKQEDYVPASEHKKL